MSERHYPRRVEDYTAAFLATSWLILFMGFFTLTALSGFGAVMLAALMIFYAIKTIPLMRRSRSRSRSRA